MFARTVNGSGVRRKGGGLFTGVGSEIRGLPRVSVVVPFAFRKTAGREACL